MQARRRCCNQPMPPVSPTATSSDAFPHLGYHAIRLAWCRRALAQWLQRWAVYLAVAVALVEMGSGDPLRAAASLAVWLVLPLFQAVEHGRWWLLMVPAQALFGAACVLGMRPLLWPAAWAEAERALPIAAGVRARSDAQVVALALLPLALLYALGAGTLVAAAQPSLLAVRSAAALALALATLGSMLLGVWLLQAARQPCSARRWRLRGAVGAAGSGSFAQSTLSVAALRRLGAIRVLLWLPLWRGPARRTGRALSTGVLMLCLPAVALWRWPAQAGWALAAWALLALTVVTRAHGLARLELTPVLDACAPLPLRMQQLERARAALCLLAPLPAAVALTAACLAALPTTRPAVLAAYLLACGGSCAWEVTLVHAKPADKAARWLFSLALCVALGSEVSA